MITPDLVDYIKKQLATGRNRQEISPPLLAQGWTPEDLNQAFVAAGGASVPPEAQPTGAPVVSPSSSFPPEEVLTPAEVERIFGPGQGPKKKVLVAIAAALALLLFGGGALAAWLFYFQSPERILSQAQAKSQQIKSSSFSGQLNLEVEAPGLNDFLSTLNGSASPAPNLPISTKAAIGATVNFEGKTDVSDKSHPKLDFSFDLVNKDQPVTNQNAFGAELRLLDQLIYLQLKESAWLPLGDLKNQWIKIDLAALKKQAEQMGAKTETNQSWQLTNEQTQKLLVEVQKLKILKITRQLPGEKIDNQNTYHYAYAIDKEALKKLILELPDILNLSAETRLTDQQKQDLDKAFSSLSEINGEIWIGKKDLFLRRESIKFGVQVDEKDVQGSAKMDLTIENKDINQPVVVETPAQTKSLEEVIGPLLQGFLGGAVSAPCDNLPTSAEKDQCYLDQAKGTDSCEKIMGLTVKNDCYYKVAQSLEDERACTQIKGAGAQGWRDECYRAVAQLKGDSLLCRNVVSSDWKNYCYATSEKNATFCQKIRKTTTRQACVSKVKEILMENFGKTI